MQINSIRPYSQNTKIPSFKGANLVQVPKKAFQSSEKALITFMEAITSADGSRLKENIFTRLSNSFNPAKDKKFAIYQENPSYVLVSDVLRRYGLKSCSAEWFSKNTGIPVNGEKHPDFHSFHVLTGKEKDAALNLFSKKNIDSIYEQAAEEINNSKGISDEQVRKINKSFINGDYEAAERQAEFLLNAKAAQILDSRMDASLKNTHFKHFRIGSLDEVKNIINELV